jgi:flagellin
MASVINTNIASLTSQRALNASQGDLQTSMQRLSTGLRINSSKDDAAGLAIATRMTSQIKGMAVATRNANDALSFSQIAEGGLSNATDSLQRMRELAVQAANGTNTSTDRTNLQAEFSQLASEIGRIGSSTTFNGASVFGTTAFVFQVGSGTADTISVSAVSAASATNAAITAGITSAASATAAIGAIDAQLDAVNTTRATLGAVQNRFNAVINQLSVSSENQSAAKSRIMDADFAAETASMTRAQILQQAGTSMLAQANSQPQNVLSLLKG